MAFDPGAQRFNGAVERGLMAFLAVLVLVSSGLRSQFDAAYDDTTDLKRTFASVERDGLWRTLASHWSIPKPDPQGQRPAYRPLQKTWRTIANCSYGQWGIWPAALATFLLLALSAWWVFELFSRFGEPVAAAFTAAAFVFFPPVVSPSWIPLAGPQCLVPGLFALGLRSYMQWLESGRVRSLLPLAICAVLGPLFKESIGILTLMLAGHQLLLAKRRSSPAAVALGLASLHGIFPSFVPTLLAGTPSLISIFEQGALHDHLAPRTLRPEFLIDLTACFPPTLLCLSLGTMAAVGIVSNPRRTMGIGQNLAVPAARVHLVLAASVALFLHLVEISTHGTLCHPLAHACTIAAFVLYALLYVDLLVAGWCVAVLGPLCLVYFNVTQCGYAAPPLIYCVAHSIAWLLKVIENRCAGLWRGALQTVVHVVVGVSLLDNGLSLVNATLAFRSLARFQTALSEVAFERLYPKHPSLKDLVHISNSVVPDDTFILYSGRQIGRGRYNFGDGVPAASVIRDSRELERISGIYDLLLVRAEYVKPRKPIVWDLECVESQFSGAHWLECRFTGWFADPLRSRFDNRYRSILCSPDFQDEFLLTPGWFCESFGNRFCVSRSPRGTLGEVILESASDIKLVEEGLQRFNILRCGEAYYGIPQGTGAFDIQKARAGSYKTCFRDKSLEGVHRKIHAAARAAGLHATSATPQPILVLEGVSGFNIVAADDEFHAIPQGEGPFGLARVRARGYSQSYSGKSLADVQQQIESRARPANEPSELAAEPAPTRQ